MDHIDEIVLQFWEKNQKKIKKFYLEKKEKTDIIISASPTFLLKPMTEKLGVYDLIASNVDKKRGKFLSNNCKGKEKVKRLKELYPKIQVEEVYTDSYSDSFLIDIAKKAYLVKGNKRNKIK